MTRQFDVKICVTYHVFISTIDHRSKLSRILKVRSQSIPFNYRVFDVVLQSRKQYHMTSEFEETSPCHRRDDCRSPSAANIYSFGRFAYFNSFQCKLLIPSVFCIVHRLTTIMAEDISGTITRQALGRIARLGDLYDARTDKFTAMSMFEQLPPADVFKYTNPVSDAFIAISSSSNDKLEELGINGELKLSILSGMSALGASAKYLRREKTSYKSVESTFLYEVTTQHERVNLYNPEVKSKISRAALGQTTATHVVVEIYRGANCAITVTDENSQNSNQRDVEASLKAHLEKLKTVISAAGGGIDWERLKQEFDELRQFSVEIVGNVFPQKFPDSVDGALETVKDVTDTIKNDVGIPLSFVMMPLSLPFLEAHLQTSNVSNLGNGQITEVLNLLDHITELKHKVHDKVVKINQCAMSDRVNVKKRTPSKTTLKFYKVM